MSPPKLPEQGSGFDVCPRLESSHVAMDATSIGNRQTKVGTNSPLSLILDEEN